MNDDKYKIIATNLSPERPIRSSEFLRGRADDLENIERELRYFHAVAFIYGHRGVGKTSLARTAAQLVTSSDREHIYVACAPESRMLQIFREIAEELLKLTFKSGAINTIRKKVEVEFSINPAIRASFEKNDPTLDNFNDVNAAIRVIKDLDSILPETGTTVVVLDELEELNADDRTDLAYLVKQIGDQEFRTKFILVGIAENVHELIGAHESVPRYLKEVSLHPLPAQYLMDIVEIAASAVNILVPQNILYRIAIVGNGFPHFAHLMGKALLIEAIITNQSTITDEVYRAGVKRAVQDSLEELRISYEAATQRGQDYFKHLIWALAHSDIVDVRIDEWIALYYELGKSLHWVRFDETKLKTAIGNFKSDSCGKIVVNTPARYGSSEMRYRYKRFNNTLMKGHVRLQAEHEGVTLGMSTTV
ncbi:MAG: ATP-binding protein [Candidatus Thiodiazotropha sp. (ex Lucinoma annulata)]|nr:ATP-binding protein [Candidatus Thiodiazotropha sp. (ex Lucinoma annulata)]